jgi:dynein heavy chain
MCPLDEIADKDYCIELFACEVFHVFRDRLISPEDRRNFSAMAHNIMEQKMQMNWKLEDFENVIFGDYDNQKRDYVKLGETNELIPRLDDLLAAYNLENSQMNLVFFEDCIQHLTRIARTLRQERGNALLVGLGGSGRQSMAKFGAGINEIKTFSIEITKSYKSKEFHEDIKMLLHQCGVEGKEM